MLFVDVPCKINNPEQAAVPLTPLEVSYREEVVKVISPKRLDELPAALASLQEEATSLKTRLRTLRGNKFLIGDSATRGAEILAKLATRVKNQA